MRCLPVALIALTPLTWATNVRGDEAKLDAHWGSISGRFLYAGVPPEPRRIELHAIGESDQNNGKNRPADPFYLRQELYDESLQVGEDRGIANVVVCVRNRSLPIHPDDEKEAREKVIVEVKDGRLTPHVAAMRASQTLQIKNADPLTLNLAWDSLGGTPFNVSLKPDGVFTTPRLARQPRPARLHSQITPWIGGWLLVRDDPFFTVSGKDGSFKIERLPVGRLEFTVWHERPGLVSTEQLPNGRFSMLVQPGINEIRAIELEPQLFTAAAAREKPCP